jgi:hypothetical protein
MENKLDTAVAFLSGDLLTTILLSVNYPELHWLPPVIHGVSIFIYGIIGGMGGLLGKKIIEWTEKRKWKSKKK